MYASDEILIRNRIQELNDILEKDEKDGTLSTPEFNLFCDELHQLEQKLLQIHIDHFLKKKKNVAEEIPSLLYLPNEESDSNMEECYELSIANILPFYKEKSLEI